MKKQKKKTKNKGRKITGRICMVTGNMMIVLVIVLCAMLVLPGIFGCHMYHVLSGSMEPAIPVGSLIYVLPEQAEDVEEDAVIAFYGSSEDNGIITHRVVKNNAVSGMFRTKGDANDSQDPTPVDYENYIGTVKLTIPYMGKVLTLLTSFYGKIAAAGVILLGVLLNIIGSKVGDKEGE